MGDVWLFDNGIYNPINVKAGEAGKNGQPNMVSLTKLLDALLSHEIDSYYLLIVKMQIAGLPTAAEIPLRLDAAHIVPHVYFVDMLEYLDFITFDAGPGQAMLKERQFYDAFDRGEKRPLLNVTQKVTQLVALLEDGDKRLIANRQAKMIRLRRDALRYAALTDHVVNQGGLNLG